MQGVPPKLYCFGQRVSPELVSLCSTKSQPQDCRSLLNLLLLDATGFPAAFSMLHFSILTPMLAQSSSVRALTYTPKSEAVAPRYTWEEGTTAQSPSRCSDVFPPSRMSSANSVLALEPSLPPSSCRRARRRDPGKAKDSTFQGSSSCFPGKPDCIFPTVKPWENQKTLYLAPRSINKDVSLDDQ